MTTQSPSLRRANEIPQASVSETKLIEEPATESLGGPVSEGLSAAPLDTDWPTLSVLSRRYIDRTLQRTHGNKTRAADMLGIDRRTLNRILARERHRRSKAAE